MRNKKEFIRWDLTGDGFKNELQQIYPHCEVLDTYIDQNTEISIRCIKHNIIFKTTTPNNLISLLEINYNRGGKKDEQ